MPVCSNHAYQRLLADNGDTLPFFLPLKKFPFEWYCDMETHCKPNDDRENNCQDNPTRHGNPLAMSRRRRKKIDTPACGRMILVIRHGPTEYRPGRLVLRTAMMPPVWRRRSPGTMRGNRCQNWRWIYEMAIWIGEHHAYILCCNARTDHS
jgi:hypothetical protein